MSEIVRTADGKIVCGESLNFNYCLTDTVFRVKLYETISSIFYFKLSFVS